MATVVEHDRCCMGCYEQLRIWYYIGLEYAHYNTQFGTVFKRDGKQYNPEWAEVAKAYGVKARKVTEEFKAVLQEALKQNEPYP